MYGQGRSRKLRTFISSFVKFGYCCLLALEGLYKGKGYYFSYMEVQGTFPLFSFFFFFLMLYGLITSTASLAMSVRSSFLVTGGTTPKESSSVP